MKTFIVLLLGFLTSGAQAQGLPKSSAIPDCFIETPEIIAENGGIECGYVTVQEKRSGGSDTEIELAYLRVFSTEESALPPLFIFGGGPGQTIVADGVLNFFQPQFLGPVLKARDVVLLEQRGTYRTRPNLTCPEISAAALTAIEDKLTSEEASDLSTKGLRACLERLNRDGVDLTAYTTKASAADVNDARIALGYEQIVFYGESYSTLLGQFVMRDFPEILAAVVLDGAESPATRSWVEDRARRAQSSLDTIVGLCAADAGCTEKFDVSQLLTQIFATFGDGPIKTSVPLPDGAPASGNISITVTRGDLADLIYQHQISPYGVAAFPYLLTQYIGSGRQALAEELANVAIREALAAPSNDESGMTFLMHLAMVCSDDPPDESDSLGLEGVGEYAALLGRNGNDTYSEMCGLINVPVLPDTSDVLVTADIPTLILSGGLDAQTPLFLAEDVVAALPDATHVIFPSGFHVQVLNLNQCATSVMLDFIADPKTHPDISCAKDSPPVTFLLELPDN